MFSCSNLAWLISDLFLDPFITELKVKGLRDGEIYKLRGMSFSSAAEKFCRQIFNLQYINS